MVTDTFLDETATELTIHSDVLQHTRVALSAAYSGLGEGVPLIVEATGMWRDLLGYDEAAEGLLSWENVERIGEADIKFMAYENLVMLLEMLSEQPAVFSGDETH